MRRSNPNIRELILVVLAVAATVYMLLLGEKGGPDGPSYILAWQNISKGVIDVERTPSYPLVIGLITELGGRSHLNTILILIQNIVALISLLYFYRMAGRILKSENAAFWTTLAIAILPVFLSWRNTVMTESLAMSGSIFLVSRAVNIYDGRSRWNILGFGLWLLFLIFLRPAFVYLLPVFAVAFIFMIFLKHNLWQRAVACLGITAVVTGLLLAYMAAFNRTYGIFSSTSIGVINDMYTMRQSGDLDPEKAPTESMKNYLRTIYEKHGTGLYDFKYCPMLWADTDVLLDSCDTKTLSKWVQDSKTLKNQLKGIAVRTYYAGKDEFLYPRLESPLGIFNATIGWLYLLLLVYAVWIIVRWRETGRLPWTAALLLMLSASNVIVAVVGAFAQNIGEWGRLIYPSLFICLIILTQLGMSLAQRIQNKR